jgi:hypothetical protein
MTAPTAPTGLYAYGLTGARPQHLALPGIDRRYPVFVLEELGLHAIVSAIDIADFQARAKRAFAVLTQNAGVEAGAEAETLLQAHEHVVATLMQEMPVVPFTFGTILRDEQAAMKLLRDDGLRFKSLLAVFTGKAEWGVKVYADRQQLARYIAQTTPALREQTEQRARLSRGTAYLAGRKMEEDLKNSAAARLAGITATMFHALADLACEAKPNKTLPRKLTGKQGDMVLNAAYLVESEQAAHFCRRGQALQAQYAPLGLSIEITGPWPPYNFI